MEPVGITGAGFMGWMLVLSPHQHCQRTDAKWWKYAAVHACVWTQLGTI